jgi:signal transduction histidine kinase
MSQPLRTSGIPVLGDISLGAHICYFFLTADDLFGTGQLFLEAGLESNELCLWLFIDPYGKEESIEAFRGLPDFERQLASGALRIERAEDWLTEDGVFNVPFFNQKWEALIAEMQQRGYSALRVGGACFPSLRWEDIRAHEQSLNELIGGRAVIMLCCFPLATTEAVAIIDVAQTHHLAIAQRDGQWEMVETPVRRLQQLEMRSRQQNAVVALGLRAIRERDVDALLKEAVTTAAQTLGTGRGMVWQTRPEHGDFILRSHAGWDEIPPGVTIPTDAGSLAGFIVASDQPVIVTDMDDDTPFEKPQVMRDWGIVSMIAGIIRGRDQKWGFLSVHSLVPRSFDADDLQFMESIANVVALTIERQEHERAELREKDAAEAALARLRAIQSITDVPLSQPALDDLLRELLGRLQEALAVDTAGVLLLDERNVLICRASVGAARMPPGTRVPLSLPLWQRLTREQRPVILEDYLEGAAPEARDWITTHMGPVQSAMAVPLVVEEKLIGAVLVNSNRRRCFEADELELLGVVADRVAPAIERGRLLESVRAGRERMEALSHRLLSVQEEERRRLAIELHDELGQILTVVKINLESLPFQVQNAVDNVDKAMQTTRDLALDLRPPMLDDLGLAAALRWYADRFAQQTNVSVHLALEEIPELAPALATACFRVAQEALTNVARHASARNAWLGVHRTDGELELTVRDDGAGFNVEAALARVAQGASMGLAGMEERVSLAGGTMDVQSTPARGTEVRVRFPVKVADEADTRVARG